MGTVLENKIMSSYKDELIAFMRTYPEHFDEAIQLALSDNQPLAWRAAFLLWGCIDDNDKRIRKHIPAIVKCLKDKDDGHQRELLKILSRMEIGEKYEGKIFDLCMNLWKQPDKVPSVRVTAFKFILKITEKYPELMNEISVLTQDHYLESLSPGVRHSVERMIKSVKSDPANPEEHNFRNPDH